MIPTAATADDASDGATPAAASASRTTAWVFVQISRASCSTHPARGKIWRCSCWAEATARPEWSNRMQRVLVVPWSIAAT